MKKGKVDNKYLVVEGFRNIEIKDVEELLLLAKEHAKNIHVQFFDADLIGGFDHLYFAALNAVKAFKTDRNISKDLAIETLLYASGQHQIEKAIQLLGIKPSSNQVVALLLADSSRDAFKALEKAASLLQGIRDDKVLEMTDKKVVTIKRIFDIKDIEIEATLRNSKKEAITSLLIERSALLATQA
jgi:KEOPS complex subunit Cgi121